MEICIFRKTQNIDSYKTASRLTIEPWFYFYSLADDTIQRLNYIVHFLDMKKKENQLRYLTRNFLAHSNETT